MSRTTKEDIREVKFLLAKFNSGEAIDDSEELEVCIPEWLEMIVELWGRIPEEDRA